MYITLSVIVSVNWRRHSNGSIVRGLGIDGNTTRHIFSLFPIKLYAFKNGIEMDKPPYAYIDVRM